MTYKILQFPLANIILQLQCNVLKHMHYHIVYRARELQFLNEEY